MRKRILTLIILLCLCNIFCKNVFKKSNNKIRNISSYVLPQLRSFSSIRIDRFGSIFISKGDSKVLELLSSGRFITHELKNNNKSLKINYIEPKNSNAFYVLLRGEDNGNQIGLWKKDENRISLIQSLKNLKAMIWIEKYKSLWYIDANLSLNSYKNKISKRIDKDLDTGYSNIVSNDNYIACETIDNEYNKDFLISFINPLKWKKIKYVKKNGSERLIGVTSQGFVLIRKIPKCCNKPDQIYLITTNGRYKIFEDKIHYASYEEDKLIIVRNEDRIVVDIYVLDIDNIMQETR